MKEVTVHRVADSRGIEGRRSGSAGGAVDAQARHQRGEWCKEQLAAETPVYNCLLDGGAYRQFGKKKGNNGAETPDSTVTKEFLSCESGWSKTIRRLL